jgi:hypothetical protein
MTYHSTFCAPLNQTLPSQNAQTCLKAGLAPSLQTKQ